MGAIKETVEKLKSAWEQKKKSDGLKIDLTIYILLGIVGTIGVCVFLILFFEDWMELVRTTHEIVSERVIVFSHQNYFYTIENNPAGKEAAGQIFLLNAIQNIAIFFSIILAVIIVSRLYFKRKLEEPLKLLKLEMEYIAKGDLSFDCSYYSRDEMGEICGAFNQMRLALIENQKNLWQLLERQRQLNAAFAHDIRTPVTVMKGYSEMLLKFYPQGRVSEEKLFETLQVIDRQADRIEKFSDTMRTIHSMDERIVEKKEISMEELMQKLSVNLRGMAAEQIEVSVTYDEGKPLVEKDEFLGKNHSCATKGKEEMLYCDANLIEEVADNLFSNALRYATEKVELWGSVNEGKLYLYVKDDGKGFSRELWKKSLRPYVTDDEGHFGMGLTICKVLCNRHEGDLEMMNSIEGGAIVCAIFGVG